MNDPLHPPAGDGLGNQQQAVSELLRTSLTPEQMTGAPVDDDTTVEAVDQVDDTEQDVVDHEDPDNPVDESLDGETGEETDGEETETADDGAVEIRDLNTLAEQIGVDLPYLYDLEMVLSDNGEPVKLGEIKDRLQEQGRVEAEREKLQTERAAFEQARTQEMASNAQMSEGIAQADAQVAMYLHQYQTTDWAALEEQDAGKTALYKQDLTNAYQTAQQQAQNARQTHQHSMQQRMDEVRSAENTKLLESVESWRDPEVRGREITGITAMAAEYGYTAQEIGNVMDSRAVRMMRDLWLKNQREQEADKTVEKVKKVPRAIRPGTPPKRVDLKKKALEKSINDAATSNDPRVKSRAIGNLLAQSGAMR